jgi:hypothetical protein
MQVPDIIPNELNILAARFESLPAMKRSFDPAEFLHGSEGWLQSCFSIRGFLAEILNLLATKWLMNKVPAKQAQSAMTVYDIHARRHAYQGTIVLSLLERIDTTLGDNEMPDLREAFRRRRDEDPHTWELVRHYGRPSVPRHLLPVFAIYAAEKKLGPMPNLTREQMDAIGLS